MNKIDFLLIFLPRSRPSNLCFRKYFIADSANFFIVFSDLTIPIQQKLSFNKIIKTVRRSSYFSNMRNHSQNKDECFDILPAKSFIPISYKHNRIVLINTLNKNSHTQPPTASKVLTFLLTLFQALNLSKKPVKQKL